MTSLIPPCPICGSRMYQPEDDARLYCERTQWPVLTATRAWREAVEYHGGDPDAQYP